MASFTDVVDRITNVLETTDNVVTGDSHGGDKPEYPGGQEPTQPGQYGEEGFDEREAKRLRARQMVPTLRQTNRSVESGSPQSMPSVSQFFTGMGQPNDGQMTPSGLMPDSITMPQYKDIQKEDVDILDALLPSYGSSDETNQKYEEYFRENGYDPYQEGDTEDVTSDEVAQQSEKDANTMPLSAAHIMDILADTGDNRVVKSVVDDGKTMDINHLTSDHVTGDAMQRYGEMGMGGRDWWLYDPYALYTKSDEQEQYGFTPYLPTAGSKASTMANQFLDAFGDTAGALGRARELATDYDINYDFDKDESTDNSVTISGSDWDYRSTPYYNNVNRMLMEQPETFLSMPEGGQVHGAPVTTFVRQTEIQDRDGTIRKLYGEPVESSRDMIIQYDDGSVIEVPDSEWRRWPTSNEGIIPPDEYLTQDVVGLSLDDSVRLVYSDGSYVHVPMETYESWYRDDGHAHAPEAQYVPIEQTSGLTEDDLARLNSGALAEGDVSYAPVLYFPDLVMSDGTRLNWFQVNDIRNDTVNQKGDPYDGITYDFGPFNIAKPRRLAGEFINDSDNVFDLVRNINWADTVPNVIDNTLGSVPISVQQAGWPTSVAKALSKSRAGIDPGKYDPLTGSDKYISIELGPNGEMIPSYDDSDKQLNMMGNALVPFTEQIVGPVGGDNPLIKVLSGKTPANPTVGQVWRSFLSGMLGEGLEEIAGNLFEEPTNNGLDAFGDPVNQYGERLLDENGEPVRDENGNYKFVDIHGQPLTYMTDYSGHVYRDPNTPLTNRVKNFLDINDLANAFAGGAVVDAAMQGLPTLARSVQAMRDDSYRNMTGLNQYVDIDGDENRGNLTLPDIMSGDVQIDPRYLSLFNDQAYREE